MSSHLSVRDRWRIISLNFDQGVNVHEIARRIPCKRNGRDRLRILNNNQVNTLRQLLYQYPTDTSSSIADRLLRRTGLGINSRTIRNYRSSLGFRPVHARSQSLINARHAQEPLTFCLSYATAHWDNVIFSDEKAVEVDISGVVYWIPATRSRPTHFQNQIQFHVVIFGAIWFDGRSNLVFIHGRTNTTTYVGYLQAAFRSYLRQLSGYYFIHDRPTWAYIVLAHDWLRRKRIRYLDNFPAVSPDLNAIESVWSWMNQYTQRNYPNSQQHLEILVQQAWNMIPQNVIRGYINNVSVICQQIISNG
ncbi:unnamed protein product, partial [Rotaria sp. Silwood1]